MKRFLTRTDFYLGNSSLRMEKGMLMVSCLSIKQVYLISILLSLVHLCQAQKHDYVWVNGYGAQWGGEFVNFLLDFNFSDVEIESIVFNNADLSDQVTCFADYNGNLHLVSNGCRLFDSFGNIIQGGDTLNPGPMYNAWCVNGGSYPMAFGLIFMPIGSKKVLAFHLGLKDDSKFGITRWPAYKSLIDISGLAPTVDSINIKVEGYHAESPAACQHGNGKDWWVVVPEKGTDHYHKYRFYGNGQVELSKQQIGYDYHYTPCPATAIHSFSPDGKTYVRYNNTCGLSFFDFDRCSGELSNERQIVLPDVFPPGASTVFSSNSRFCYYNSSRVIMQVDLEADILQSDTIAIVDTFPAPFNAGFALMQRGPDGRIYICTTSSTKSWHVIEYPDLKGVDCWAQPNAMDFPSWSFIAIPNIPNYRLGALEGSPCDTLSTSIAEPGPQVEMKIYPNPASGPVQIEITLPEYGGKDTELVIHDALGREVHRHRFSPYAYLHLWDTSQVPNGTYILQLYSDERPVATSRVVVMRE